MSREQKKKKTSVPKDYRSFNSSTRPSVSCEGSTYSRSTGSLCRCNAKKYRSIHMSSQSYSSNGTKSTTKQGSSTYVCSRCRGRHLRSHRSVRPLRHRLKSHATSRSRFGTTFHSRHNSRSPTPLKPPIYSIVRPFRIFTRW